MYYGCVIHDDECDQSGRVHDVVYLSAGEKILTMSTTIKVNPNGSFRVEGEFKIIDADGNEFNINGRTSVALCRCNLSKNRPFCDGSHKGNFSAESKAFELPPPAPKPQP